MTSGHQWRKSSRSASTDNCVELAGTLDALRDSKNPAGPTLTVTDLGPLLTEIKTGRFDH